MNRDKQIEEMEIALREAQYELDKAWHECLHNKGAQPRREFLFTAQYLVENKGYRKASEVAREIIAEIDNALNDMAIEYHNAGHPLYYAVCEMVHHKVIAPIEKKYTEGAG